jgi:hypothetical protein
MRRSPEQTRPTFRRLRIFAIDPMISRDSDHQVTVQIQFEDLELRDNTTAPSDPQTRAPGPVDPVSFRGPLGWALGDPSADPFAVDYRGVHEDRT